MGRAAVILIVDDDPRGCEALEGLLLGQGYDLVFAHNGPEALRKAEEHSPDLILLDVMMPGMDGFEVCRRIRDSSSLAEVPVIMVTALDDQDSCLEGIKAGADDFISKPFNRVELRARIRTVTRLNRHRRLTVEREQSEWIVDQADEGYLIINEHDEIIYSTVKARLYTGLLGDTEPGEKFLSLVKNDYCCEPSEAWQQWPPRDSLSLKRYLIRHQKPSVNARWLQVTAFERSLGNETSWLIRLREVTSEIDIRRNHWILEKILYHRLRSPLNAVRASLEILLRDDAGASKHEIQDYTRSAIAGVKRLSGEIQEISQFIETPILALSGKGFRIAMIPSLVSRTAAGLGMEDVTTSIRDDDIQASLSLQALEVIVRELLENAKKFHPQGRPSVEITAEVADNSMIKLLARDDGLTLSSNQLARAWMPYYKGEQGGSPQPGRGLGLAVVASLIWQIGGTCRMYNREPVPGIVIELNIPVDQGQRRQ